MSHGADAFRISKRKVMVDLAFRGGVVKSFGLLVVEWPPKGVIDLLGEQPFIPAEDLTANEWVILNRDAIFWVCLPLVESVELFSTNQSVVIELTDGTSISGNLLYSAPVAQSRVVDHLNTPERLLSVWSSDRRFFVNKHCIAQIRER